jgi:beta-glucosidase
MSGEGMSGEGMSSAWPDWPAEGDSPGAAEAPLPPGFFGTATAAFQVEGANATDGRGESIWDRFCATPGAVAGGATGEVACDHYHRWPEDLDLMVELGIETYRFSLAWPRIVPTGSGAVNQAGLDFYRRLVDGLLERGIEPMLTLYHWDLPQALQDTGGWERRDTAERFAEYAAVVAGALGDRVGQWLTHNEPWVTAFLGHAVGSKAPGIRDWGVAVRASHHVLLSHGLALAALRAELPSGARCGIALNPAPVRAARDEPEDHAAVERYDGYLNRWFLDPVFLGRYPDDTRALYEARYGPVGDRPGDLELISAPIDLLGVNYYNPHTVQAAPDVEPFGLVNVDGPGPRTAMGWEVDADAFAELLVRLRDDYGDRPMAITENGAAFDDHVLASGEVDDAERVAYLESHLAAVLRARQAGVDVRTYCVWSLLDNLEWEEGYDKRFGIVHVDFDTLARTPKASARWYQQHAARARGRHRSGPGTKGA